MRSLTLNYGSSAYSVKNGMTSLNKHRSFLNNRYNRVPTRYSLMTW